MAKPPEAYAGCGAADWISLTGAASAVSTIAPRNTRNTGVSTLPTHVRIFPGLMEKARTAAKKQSEKSASGSVPASAPSSGATPTVNETVAQRGMAKSGPIVR